MDYRAIARMIHNVNDTRLDNEKESKSSVSLEAVLSAFVPALITGLIYVAIFALIRHRYPNIYAPRTYMGTIPQKHRLNVNSSSRLSWISVMWNVSDRHLLYHQSMDSYLFLRFLRTTIFICVVGSCMTWPILMPVNAAGGGSSTQLDRVGIGNVNKESYFYAHSIIAWVFMVFVMFTIARERLWLIGLRQAWAFSKSSASKLSSRTVLFLSAPEAALEENNMRHFFGDGAIRIWPATNVTPLQDLVADQQSMVEKLELAETSFIKRAYRTAVKQCPERGTEHLDDISYESLTQTTREAIRPKHYLKYPIVSQKVDTIHWLRKTIKEKESEIKEAKQRQEQDSDDTMAVFVEFKTIAEAQQALQQVASADMLTLQPRYLGVSPKEVLWQNLPIPLERRIFQQGIGLCMVIALIVFWSIPSGFVGVISNISYLAENVEWLAWLKKLPSPIIGLLSGLVPPLLTSLLSKYVPTIFRMIFASFGGATTTENELRVQKWFYVFQVTQVFLVTAVFSSATAVFSNLIERAKNPISIPELLAKQLPKSSNYYLTYFIVQGISTATDNLLNWTDLVQYLLFSWIFDKTPRQKFNRYTSMKGIAWGKVFPKLTNFAIIAIAYSCIAPLVLGFGAVGLFFNYLSYRYNLLFVMQPKIDTQGQAYTLALQHLLTGVYIAELALIGLFGLGRATGPAVMMTALFLVTIVYNTLMNRYLAPLEKYLPAEIVNQLAAGEESTPLLASAEAGLVGEQPESHIQHLGQQAHLPDRVIDPVARFFEPQVSTSYQAMKDWLREDKTDFQDYEEDAPSYSEDQLKRAYLNPALSSSLQVIWLPRDEIGASKNEVSENEKEGLRASDRGAWIDHKGRVQWNKSDIEDVPIWKASVAF